MTRTAATITAFAVAAFVPVILWAGVGVLQSGSFAGIWVALFYVPFSIAAILVLAVPLFLLLNRLRWVNLWTTLGGGAMIGAAMAVAFAHPLFPSNPLYFCLTGIGTALSFWVTRHLLESSP